MSFFHFKNIKVSGIVSAVPLQVFTEEQLFSDFEGQKVKEYLAQTGFHSVRKSVDLQTASDLGFEAASQLLELKNINRSQIGFIVFLTKTPDYRSPATAIVLQHRLGLPIDCVAYDVNLGSVGFVAGLQLGCSLLNGLNTSQGLIIIGDTNSKQTSVDNLDMMHLGDAATAILLEKDENAKPIKTKIFSEGSGYDANIIAGGGFRTKVERPNYELSSLPTTGSFNKLMQDRNRIHQFYSQKIPLSVIDFLSAANSKFSDYDFLAFEQSNKNTAKNVREAIGENKIELNSVFNLFGDTSGSSIPLLLSKDKMEFDNIRILSCAYGEGYSWGFADFYLEKDTVMPIIETDNYFTEGFITHEM